MEHTYTRKEMSDTTRYIINAFIISDSYLEAVNFYEELQEWCTEHNAEYSAGRPPHFITSDRSIKITNGEDKVAFILKYGQYIRKNV